MEPNAWPGLAGHWRFTGPGCAACPACRLSLCSVCHDYKCSLERSLWPSQLSRGQGCSHGSWLVSAGASDHIHHRPGLFSLQGSHVGLQGLSPRLETISVILPAQEASEQWLSLREWGSLHRDSEACVV